MALLIGMDEAGYGPNLGPLVITVTVWEVDGDPRRIDLWKMFAGVVDQSAPADGEHIQIADSKQVYSPARGLAQLERGVLCALALSASMVTRDDCRDSPATFRALHRRVAIQPSEDLHAEPWFARADVALPVAGGEPATSRTRAAALTSAWNDRCLTNGVRLLGIWSDVVLTQRFNGEMRRHDSKGRALSELSMELLRHACSAVAADGHDGVLVIADKHGGRNRYHEFLPIVYGEAFIRCLAESMDLSRYRVGNAEVRFETKSERHLPVALASMVSKYLRELSMLLFNRYWMERQPGLKPTAGYPLDAQRFRTEIAALQQQLGIADDVLWRER